MANSGIKNAPAAIVVTYTRNNDDDSTSELFRQKINTKKLSDNNALDRSRYNQPILAG